MAERTRCEICNRDFPNQDALTMHNSAKHLIQEKPKSSNNKIFIGIFIIAVLVISGFLLLSGKSTTGNVINNEGNIQKITLSMKGNYYPNTINVKQGVPVEITLDSSVRGCYRSFNIRELGVSKYSSGPSDTIKFTPNKKGSFEFACGMRMGTGTIIVD